MRAACMIMILLISLTSCGGKSSDASPPALSSGLKIFVTASQHVADFKNDPFLQGSTAIQKADSFCNNDANKPNSSTYKALIIDGTSRAAVPLTDWVLLPDRTYYRPYGDIEVGTTTNSAIFASLFRDLTNSISDRRPENSDFLVLTNNTWTGISSASNFTNSGQEDCDKWSIAVNSSSFASIGTIYEKTSTAFSSSGGIGCGSFKASLYCVEQP